MRIILPFAIIGVPLALLTFLFFIPLNLYLDINSKIRPQALSIGDSKISWSSLKEELMLVSLDKTLKTRGAKLQRALDQAEEREILKQTLGPEAESFSNLIPYHQLQNLRKTILEKGVNWRTGGYFIARFTVPEATESAQVLKDQAKAEITTLKTRLDRGFNFQRILAEATTSATIKYLNGGAFLPGMYLEKVTEDKFPLQIKSFKELFFSQDANSVSDILTLSWNDYDGPNYGNQLKDEFAYAVIKIDEANPQEFNDYQSWLNQQRKEYKIQSFIFIPFFFKWF